MREREIGGRGREGERGRNRRREQEGDREGARERGREREESNTEINLFELFCVQNFYRFVIIVKRLIVVGPINYKL